MKLPGYKLLNECKNCGGPNERRLYSDVCQRCADADKSYPPVLDACCGSRMFWFNKADPRCLYVDNRRETWVTDTRPGHSPTVVDPDVLADFGNLPFPDNTFAHVVFDPPHHTASGTRFRSVKKPGWAMRKYGWLGDNWRDVLRAGFAECFRVLRPEGTLVFKWAEKEIPVAEVVKLAGHAPMYGHRSGKQATTHWIAFLKPNATAHRTPGAKTTKEV